MKLYSKIYGNKEESLIIIHGLFGMSDNWHSLARKFQKHYTVHLIDLRNHGRSPHSEIFNYEVMCMDLLEYIQEHNLKKPIVLGHSLGGKVAMGFAFSYPHSLSKLIIADIAPRCYSTEFHKRILDSIVQVPLKKFSSRDEVDRALSVYLDDKRIRLFLMKNIYRDKDHNFNWRFNINVLLEKVNNISGIEFLKGKVLTPTYFIKGGNSNYINSSDEDIIKEHFSNFKISTIDNAGHWLHAEYPEDFYNNVISFSLP